MRYDVSIRERRARGGNASLYQDVQGICTARRYPNKIGVWAVYMAVHVYIYNSELTRAHRQPKARTGQVVLPRRWSQVHETQIICTIIKIGTPGDLEGRPSLYAGSWRDV